MKRELAISAAVVMVIAALGTTSANAQGCDPSRNAFCECQRDDDCINRSMPLMAGVCSSGGTCDNKFSPWTPRLTGSVDTFCNAYVNGCQSASLTLSKDGTRVRVAITGPGDDTAKQCSLKATLGSSGAESRTAGRIADSVQACVHNVPVYFYSTMKRAQDGIPGCCNYDWSYRPGAKTGR